MKKSCLLGASLPESKEKYTDALLVLTAVRKTERYLCEHPNFSNWLVSLSAYEIFSHRRIIWQIFDVPLDRIGGFN